VSVTTSTALAALLAAALRSSFLTEEATSFSLKLLSSSFQIAALLLYISLWHTLTRPKCLLLVQSHHIVIYTEILACRMTSKMKGNTDMHMDGVHTLYFFLCGNTAEIVGVSINMVGTK
jgi:hypothetical protein